MCHHFPMNNFVVIDTSVLISALLGPAGPSRELIRRCLQGRYKPLISNTLFQEYEDVTSRPHILDKCPLTQAELRELLNAYYSAGEWVHIYYLWRPNLPDESDNFLIELAVAGNANCIVTNNVRDLRDAELIFPDLHITTPEQLLRG